MLVYPVLAGYVKATQSPQKLFWFWRCFSATFQGALAIDRSSSVRIRWTYLIFTYFYRDMLIVTKWKRQISDIGLGVKWPWFSKGTFFEKAESCLWEEEASFRSLSNCAWQHNITPLEKSCKGPHFHVVPGFKLDQQQFSCKQILFMGAGGKSNYALLFLTPLEIGVFFLYIQKRNSIPSDVSLLLWKTLDGRSFSSLGGSVGVGQLFWLSTLHHTLSLLD